MKVTDITTDMPGLCQQNREREVACKAYKEAHRHDGFVSYTLAELRAAPEGPQYVAIDEDGWIAIDMGGGGSVYDFELAQVYSQLEMINWIQHLNRKSWVTPEHIEQFIKVVCKAKRWKIDL